LIETSEEGGRWGRDVLYDLRRNDLAGTAPGCKGIENDDLVVLNGGLELCFAAHQNVSLNQLKTQRSNASKANARDIKQGGGVP
jgi:hypothetical protein